MRLSEEVCVRDDGCDSQRERHGVSGLVGAKRRSGVVLQAGTKHLSSFKPD